MAKPKGLELPKSPEFQSDQTFQQGNQSLLDYGGQLASGNLPEWLQSTINPNNSANALSAAQGLLQPQFRDTLQQIKNQAAGAGSLESSTFTDALARSQSDLNSQYQSIVSGQAINDANQSNTNKLNLFGSGLGVIQNATGFGLQNQDQKNQFNLQNYGNLVADAIQKNQNSRNPGFFGNFISGISPLAHDIYSSSGYNVGGMGIQQAALTAASMFGGGIGGTSTGNVGTSPGMNAQNFSLSGSQGPQGNAFQQYLYN